MRPHLMLLRVAYLPLVFVLAMGQAHAADSSSSETASSDHDRAEKRGPLFPPFKKKAAAQAEEPAPSPQRAAGPDPNAPAVEPPSEPPPPTTPSEGIMTWVDRMEGEIPSKEQIKAIQEATETHDAERALVDELSGGEIPVAFYDDPQKALTEAVADAKGVDPAEFDIPIEVNPAVEKWIQYFTGSGRKYYERWLSRAPRYQPMMREKLAKAGLPQDLVYLSMIESGYNPHAYSHSDAAGLWQFIPSTGRVYDLRIDWWVDDRRDPEKSLAAAITFLGELHRMFGDWRLAWAAYNGGPGRVKRAIDRAGSKDFWTLASGTHLHPETENYVPKIMAAAIIGHHPERYGFGRYGSTDEPPQEPLQYDVARVEGSVEFEVLARCAGTTVDELKELNPALRRFATPAEGYEVRIPRGTQETFLAALSEVPAEQRITVVRHTVRRGETLSTIASRYNTTVDDLSRANQLKNVNRIVVGMNLVIPRNSPGWTPPPEPPATKGEPGVVLAAVGQPQSGPSVAKVTRPASKSPSVHVVKGGETLTTLAERYGTTVAAIKSKNGLKSSTILVGQRLQLPDGSAASVPSAPRFHVVAPGETLSKIARRYNLEPAKLQEWNRISDPSHIEVGQRVSVDGPNPGAVRWTQYVVQRGDSLSKIATRHACTVEELRSWNSLKDSVIQPGQTLKIQN
jgi:membrane-bound lytic murein transglycosylase D